VNHPQNFLLEHDSLNSTVLPGMPAGQTFAEFTLQGELDYIREYIPDRKMHQNLEKITGTEELLNKLLD
jgi:hypothetical protein